MEITSLSNLLKEDDVVCKPSGILLTVDSSWIIDGEDRLSYTTLIRLVECCREYHWQTDILPECAGFKLDSICKSLTANFIKPIQVGTRIFIKYYITTIRRKGYSINFKVYNATEQFIYAEVDIISIFYDPLNCVSIVPPPFITNGLNLLCRE